MEPLSSLPSVCLVLLSRPSVPGWQPPGADDTARVGAPYPGARQRVSGEGSQRHSPASSSHQRNGLRLNSSRVGTGSSPSRHRAARACADGSDPGTRLGRGWAGERLAGSAQAPGGVGDEGRQGAQLRIQVSGTFSSRPWGLLAVEIGHFVYHGRA